MSVKVTPPCQGTRFINKGFVCSFTVADDKQLTIDAVRKLNVLKVNSQISVSQARQIPFIDIISVTFGKEEWKVNPKLHSFKDVEIATKSILANTTSSCYCLTINFVQRKKDCKWKLQTLKFKTFESDICEQWATYLQNVCQAQIESKGHQRPEKLLVFVNPYGGRRKAKQTYESVVAPIFQLCNIHCTVITTQYKDHAKEYVENEDLSPYCGIVSVGGDGILHEIINGIILRTQKEEQHDIDITNIDKPFNYAKPKLRIGIIPAGSTDCLCYTLHGVIDPETAALHIAVGDRHPLDMCSIHTHFGKLIQYSFAMTSYGFYGNVLKRSEQMRAIGPSRYDLAGFQSFVQLKSYPGEIKYLPCSYQMKNDLKNDTSKCRYPCSICLGNREDVPIEANMPSPQCNNNKACSEVANIANNWKVVQGDYMVVTSSAMSCACAKSPQGLSPSAHLADGNTDLILVKRCSKPNFFKYLLSHLGSGNRFDFPFVEAHRVRAFKYTAIKSPSYDKVAYQRNSVASDDVEMTSQTDDVSNSLSCWNSDGEFVNEPNIYLWVHRGLVDFFARGIED